MIGCCRRLGGRAEKGKGEICVYRPFRLHPGQSLELPRLSIGNHPDETERRAPLSPLQTLGGCGKNHGEELGGCRNKHGVKESSFSKLFLHILSRAVPETLKRERLFVNLLAGAYSAK